jgi:hypothetical protein
MHKSREQLLIKRHKRQIIHLRNSDEYTIVSRTSRLKRQLKHTRNIGLDWNGAHDCRRPVPRINSLGNLEPTRATVR